MVKNVELDVLSFNVIIIVDILRYDVLLVRALVICTLFVWA